MEKNIARMEKRSRQLLHVDSITYLLTATHIAAKAILKCAHLLHIYLDNIFVCPLLAPSHKQYHNNFLQRGFGGPKDDDPLDCSQLSPNFLVLSPIRAKEEEEDWFHIYALMTRGTECLGNRLLLQPIVSTLYIVLSRESS